MRPAAISSNEGQQQQSKLDRVRSWSDLPSDLLKIITSHLMPDLVDYSNFRAVCTNWRSGTEPTHLPVSPLVLLPRDPLSDHLSFFHLPSSKKLSSSSPFPEIRDKTVLGSGFGWLALASCSDSSLSLFNPFTRSHILLPPLPPPPPEYGPFSQCGPPYDGNRYDLRAPRVGKSEETDSNGCRINRGHPRKVYLSKSPSSEEEDEDGGGSGCIVAATLHTTYIAICRLGDENPPRWEHINLRIWRGGRTYRLLDPYEFVFLDDSRRFYVFSSFGELCIVDLGAEPEAELPEWVQGPVSGLRNVRFHVVRAGGELFMAKYVRSRYRCSRTATTTGGGGGGEIRVYKLMGSVPRRWEEVSSIGDFAFFLSGAHSLAVRASEAEGCRADCVYFSGIYGHLSGEEEEEDERQQAGVHYMDVFDLKENKLERMSCPWEKDFLTDTWITPCFH